MSIEKPRTAVDLGTTTLSSGVSFVPPAEVTRLLARAVLLYGVPFQYLVPDERMLPPESIRFFYLDPSWIAALIQGATSVGRMNEPGDLDRHLRHHALSQALIDAAQVREKGVACEEPRVQKANWPLSGFLLRSTTVEGFQGVEMRATGEGDQELAPLRIDRLGPDILLCIFNGKVKTLTVEQPPEGLHFGLSPSADGQYQRLGLRKVTQTSGGVEPGERIKASAKPIDVPMRQSAAGSGRPTRVIRMAELAERFQGRLEELGHRASVFTSAEMGVELVESPGLVVFAEQGSS